MYTTKGDYLGIAYIANDTLFQFFSKTTPACTIKKKPFSDHPVPTHRIFPRIIKDQRQLKTVAIQILVIVQSVIHNRPDHGSRK